MGEVRYPTAGLAARLWTPRWTWSIGQWRRSIRLRHRGPHPLATACAYAAPSASSSARPGNARHGCPRDTSASRPWRRHTPANWRTRHARYRGVPRKHFHLYPADSLPTPQSPRPRPETVVARASAESGSVRYRTYSCPDSLGITQQNDHSGNTILISEPCSGFFQRWCIFFRETFSWSDTYWDRRLILFQISTIFFNL